MSQKKIPPFLLESRTLFVPRVVLSGSVTMPSAPYLDSLADPIAQYLHIYIFVSLEVYSISLVRIFCAELSAVGPAKCVGTPIRGGIHEHEVNTYLPLGTASTCDVPRVSTPF